MTAAVYWFICTQASYPSAIPAVAARQQAFNRATSNAIAGLSKSRHQVGDLLARPNPSAVNNHLLCDGSAVLRSGFPQLFKTIGTDWGAGDGITTFNIPNLLGTAIPNATTAPPQVIGEATASTGDPIIEPATAGETGGSRGGNISSGGRTRQDLP